ncbi:Retrovirus-related Pol polyprotein from transposon TNT 1-94 [Papilio machaon]|uniref:Retrovirus-related Pol polyprotein from transposon TNT 1-94 n=1 Tax=Papilio machaon TaxID=76193 RepID=A0A194RU38_PAPMA|nr:Retrovirus-related Pol polyprotein from transposon TNT 1-94 [Papilio machaon]
MSTSNPLTLIEKLSGRENYSTWKFALKTYLQHEDLWDCITGSGVVDEKRDTKAKSKIILLVDTTNYIHIQDCKTAKEVWDNLAKAFDDSGLTRRVGLLRELCTTTLQACQNIEEYVSIIMTTAHKLRNIGFKVDDEWLGTLLLSGLPDSYQPMIIALESSGLKISADSVKSKLLQDIKMNERQSSSAFATNKSFKKTAFYKNKTGKQNFQKGPRCYSCNKYGHISTDCKTKKITKSSSYAAAFTATNNNSDAWYIDSGASVHMTRYENLLSNTSESLIKSIKVANDKSLNVKCSGQVTLNVSDQRGQHRKVLFQNVLCVPELATNLISVSQIIRNGGQVKFNSKGCVILNKNNNVVATAILVNNMYQLNMYSEHAYISDVDENDPYLWHQRMGHLNFNDLNKIIENTEGMKVLKKKETNLTCITCLEAKQTRLPFKHKGTGTTKLLELVHSDVCGPMETESLGGAKYFLTFTDDYSKKIFVYFLQKKSEVIDKLKEFKKYVENQLECKIKCLRTDNGLEFINKNISDLLKGDGITHQTTVPYTPQQNGVAERLNRTLVEKAKCMLLNAKLSKQFWAEAVQTAAYLLNRTPTKSLKYKTPEEMWSGTKPSVSHLHIFGCEAMVHLPKEKTKKWDPKAKKAIFTGYCTDTKGYRFIIPSSGLVIKSRDAVFLESTVVRNYVPVDLTHSEDKSVSEELRHSSESTSTNTIASPEESESDESMNSSIYVPDRKIEYPMSSNVTLRPRNKQSQPKTKSFESYLCYNDGILDVPLTYSDAITSADSDKWKMSISEELQAHSVNKTWTLVEKPKNAKVIGCKWVFKVKDEPTGLRYKSRLCAKGYAQTKGMDYDETFSPTVRYDSIRLLLSVAAEQNLEILQFDIKTAFLYGELSEQIFMVPPDGLQCAPNMVCKLNKSLYGLKQAPRCWNTKFNAILEKFGFVKSLADQCVYVGQVNEIKCYLCLYVDDGLLISKERLILKKIVNELQTHFDLKTCSSNNFVGMQIERNKEHIFIHQTKYIEKILEKFNMDSANPNSIPSDPHIKLQKGDAVPARNLPYREAVGSLIHLATVSRPDIAYAVSVVSQFLHNYNESHWNAVKKIFKYLKGTIEFGLCYQSKPQSTELIGYSDADYANDIETRRSMTGYVFIKNGAAVTWSSQRQQSVALSTTEAEFMAACAATKEIMWLKQLLCDIGQYKQVSVCLNIDNQSAINVIKNSEFHKRCKHIDIKYNFIKEKYQQNVISLNYVNSVEQFADIFTKSLPRERFKLLRSNIGMLSLNT